MLHNALKQIKNLSSHKITNRTTTGKASADRNTKITLALTAPGRNHVVCKIFTTYADCYHDRLATISTNIKPTLEYLSENHEIQENDKIYTSGKEGIFAPGIPIGEAKIEKEEIKKY